MSTHSIVGHKEGSGSMRVIYVHWDGYPEGVGQQLMDWMAGQPVERRKFVIDKLLAEPVGWSALCNADIDLEPGWNNDPEARENDLRPQSYSARGEGIDNFVGGLFGSIAGAMEECDSDFAYIVSEDYSEMYVYRAPGNLIGEVSLAVAGHLKDLIRESDEYDDWE